MTDSSNLLSLTDVMNAFHKKFPSLATATSDKIEKAIDWLDDYQPEDEQQLNEEAIEWLLRTKSHLRERL